MHASANVCPSSELLPWSFMGLWALVIMSVGHKKCDSCLRRRDERCSWLKMGDGLRAFLDEDGSTACDTFKCLCLSGSGPEDFQGAYFLGLSQPQPLPKGIGAKAAS